MTRESSAAALDFSDDSTNGLYDDGLPSIGANNQSQYFAYAQSVFQTYRGVASGQQSSNADCGQLIITNVFVATEEKPNSVQMSENAQIHESAMSILNGEAPLSQDSMSLLNDILEIGFAADAFDDAQYRALSETLKARAARESLVGNDHVAFELEGMVRAVNYIRSERRNALRAA